VLLRVVQIGQEVRRPGDGVGLARARGVLDEVLLPGTFVEDRGDQLAGGVELVEAGEDHLGHLPLLVLLRDEVAAEQLQPAVALPDVLPQVRGGVAVGVRGVALAAVRCRLG
jgi:hypothetical protein